MTEQNIGIHPGTEGLTEEWAKSIVTLIEANTGGTPHCEMASVAYGILRGLALARAENEKIMQWVQQFIPKADRLPKDLNLKDFFNLATQREKDAATVAELVDALYFVLPLSKGYAAEHPVGANQRIVNTSIDTLEKHKSIAEKGREGSDADRG